MSVLSSWSDCEIIYDSKKFSANFKRDFRRFFQKIPEDSLMIPEDFD